MDVTLTVLRVMLALGLVMVNVAVAVLPNVMFAGNTVVTTVGASVFVPLPVPNNENVLPATRDDTLYCPAIDPGPPDERMNGTVQEALGANGAAQMPILLLSGGAEAILSMVTGILPTLKNVTPILEVDPAGVGPGMAIVMSPEGANQPLAGESVVPLNAVTAVSPLIVMPKFAPLRPTGCVKGKK